MKENTHMMRVSNFKGKPVSCIGLKDYEIKRTTTPELQRKGLDFCEEAIHNATILYHRTHSEVMAKRWEATSEALRQAGMKLAVAEDRQQVLECCERIENISQGKEKSK